MDVLTEMRPVQAAALWSGLLILLMVILAGRVIAARRSNKVLLGDGGNAEVTLRGRVFGNAAEYVPLGLIGLIGVSLLGMPAVYIHALGAALFMARVLHAAGLSDKRPTTARAVGIVLTLLVLLTLGLMLVLHAFVPGPGV